MGIDGVMNKTNKTFVFERERIWSSHFTVIFGYLTMANTHTKEIHYILPPNI